MTTTSMSSSSTHDFHHSREKNTPSCMAYKEALVLARIIMDLGSKQKKKKGRRAWKIWLCRYCQSFARRAAKLPKTALRWSQSSNYSNQKQWSTYKGRKIEWLALFFFSKESNLEYWEKGKVKVTENCVENMILHTRQHHGWATCPVNSRPAYQA